MNGGKTSTFTIHHDRCDPRNWTLDQWRILQEFIREPLLQRAAVLSKLGIQLVLSEHHEAKGGNLESFGYADEREMPHPDSISDDMEDITLGDDITPVVEVFRGPTKYAARYATATADGEYDGTEHELFDTEAEAESFLRSLREPETA